MQQWIARLKRTSWLISFALLCVIIFVMGHMLDSDIKWVAVPLVIILLLAGVS